MPSKNVTSLAAHKDIIGLFKVLKNSLMNRPFVPWTVTEGSLLEFLIVFTARTLDALSDSGLLDLSQEERNKLDVNVRIFLKRIEEANCYIPNKKKLVKAKWRYRDLEKRTAALDMFMTKFGFAPSDKFIDDYLAEMDRNKAMEKGINPEAAEEIPDRLTNSTWRERKRILFRWRFDREPTAEEIDEAIRNDTLEPLSYYAEKERNPDDES